ncbi:MAG: aminomethyltransferase family protein [Salinisphaera sp.]|uniref:aminomethyltransferase family protein n=1 Tax=Salinisphaera sp. TaxID=1914330 RepID=UPI003C7E8258
MTDAALLHTPFHAALAPLNKIEAWERWQGYATVPCFYNEGQEYAAIRNSASLYDLSPMIKYAVTGADAPRFINRLITRDIERLRPGRCLYSPWCDGEGHIIEDGIVFRFAHDRFQINCGEHNLTWFLATAAGLDVRIEDVSERFAALSLQGPLSRDILLRAGVAEAAELRYFRLLQTRLGEIDVTITRTGFTGDLGYELWVGADDAMALWSALMAAGDGRLVPIGSRALDIARIEAGHIQVHSEYQDARTSVDITEKRSPYELGLDWALDFRKNHFNGRRALLAQKEAGGPPLRLVGLELAGRRPALDCVLYARRRVVGQTTAAAWSPLLKKSIALALVEARWAEPGTELRVEVHYRRELRLLRSDERARVVAPRFIDLPRRRE